MTATRHFCAGLRRRQFLVAAASLPLGGQAHADAAFLHNLERRTFQWFWDTTDATTGLVPDRWPTPSFSSIAAIGFGLAGCAIGATRGWVTREQARQRSLRTLRFLAGLRQGEQQSAGHEGFFFHFLEMKTGLRSARCELSTVDTALLLAGAMVVERFFDAPQADEAAIRELAQALNARVNWRWAQVRGAAIGHGWLPESGALPYDWKGYNEAMLVYLLALGSDTYGVDRTAWGAWTSTYPDSWGESFGRPHEKHLGFAPLFGHQFTQCFVDLRGLRDAWGRAEGLDYFENSRRATHAQRAYASANPLGWKGYSADVWGISACDGPADVKRTYGGTLRQFHSYAGRGQALYDDGTLAPYAMGASLPFAPEIVVPGLQAIRRRHPAVWGRYGYRDAFNPSFTFTDVKLTHGRVLAGQGWVASDYLGIDQGPLLLMLANHRDGLIWRLLREHPQLQRGLARAGFRAA